jgi:hypothetical protein
VSQTDTQEVANAYNILEKGDKAARAPDVADYRNLFKRATRVEFGVDSPAFRQTVDKLDENIEELRGHLQLMVDRCRLYSKNGSVFAESGKEFANVLISMNSPAWTARLGNVAILLSKFGETFEEVRS